MSTSLFGSTGNGAGAESQGGADFSMNDPFVSSPTEGTMPRESHRYSSFDTQLFSLNAASPGQAKRALEAHLAETERRLEEASKLGTALIDQQRDLEEKLKEVERQQDEGEIGPDLRRKLADLEREYNEIGRESARAFLGPKRMASGGDDGHLGTPSADQKVILYNPRTKKKKKDRRVVKRAQANILMCCSLLSTLPCSPVKRPTHPAR